MKSHYDLLGVEPGADLETIKKAFRREIARYHPDKVIHLGAEFEELASSRAAELTAAYNVLTDAASRAEYDDVLRGQGVIAAGARYCPPPPPAAAVAESPAPSSEPPSPPPSYERFEQERAGRDDILRRAVLARVREVLRQFVGDCEMADLKGFDAACLSKARATLFRRAAPPSVLVKLAPMIDPVVATEAWRNAVKARLQHKPVILLLLGHRLAPAGDLARAIEEQRRKSPALAETLFPVPVDIRDWSAKIPANAPASVRTLIDGLKSFVG